MDPEDVGNRLRDHTQLDHIARAIADLVAQLAPARLAAKASEYQVSAHAPRKDRHQRAGGVVRD
jgi:hypothetical protein